MDEQGQLIGQSSSASGHEIKGRAALRPLSLSDSLMMALIENAGVRLAVPDQKSSGRASLKS
ncbi:hypothetical protein SAMN05444506_106246 [Pseudomonas syringae]|uniref:Uncharacterized protein n=2 Tax=Pseudomonas TaxID=286 RepID=A0A3M3MZP3_9PSED|nr:hypothetical protein ALQ58_03816 [Pseudomonas syringae pv. apii]RMN52761.1 hypothetical protein ALQ59_02108 [Pseudomonas syringae pv. apii]RMN90744.1 hypothetical protein ALQ49_02888 [Pseudomonas syringae pv. apii]SDY87996.1 hypothetical protein SAMN05444506_106246 [Pseudomonas syringae]